MLIKVEQVLKVGVLRLRKETTWKPQEVPDIDQVYKAPPLLSLGKE